MNAVAQGALVLLSGSAIVRASSLVSQFALAYMLTPDDFGTFAAAIGFSSVFQVLRDGGAATLLVRHATASVRDAIPSAVHTVVRVGRVLAVIAVAVSAALATTDAVHYRTAALMLVMVASSLIGARAAVAVGAWQVIGDFGKIRHVEVTTTLIRHALTIAMAIAGSGAVAFGIGALGAGLYERVAGTRGIRSLTPHRTAPDSRRDDLLVASSAKWIMAGTVSATAAQSVDYAILGVLLPVGELGIYYFAYQLAFAGFNLVNQALYRALAPAFVSTAQDPDRTSARYVNALRVVADVAAPALVAGGLLFPALETVLWSGKWAGAESVVLLFCLVVPVQLGVSVAAALTTAEGLFRYSTVLWALRAAGIAAAAVVGSVAGTAVVAAASVAGITAVTGLLHVLLIARRAAPAAAAQLLPAFVAPLTVLCLPALALVGLRHTVQTQVAIGASVAYFAVLCIWVALRGRAALGLFKPTQVAGGGQVP